jgi:pimeloyl-ACP methyl ester carboxylesterase
MNAGAGQETGGETGRGADSGQVMLAPYLDAPPLHITYMAGRSDRLILAFSGVGERHHAIQTPEAIKLTGWDGENHVLFISDASRSWMNTAGLAQAIVAAVQSLVDQLHPARIIAFGNSMGGTMALIFAGLFPLDNVLAMVPQFSVNAEVMPQENRWQHFRRNIAEWPYPSVPPLQDNPAQIMILHGGDKFEMLHAKRFAVPAGVDHYVMPPHGHNLAAALKKQKVLRPLLQAVIMGDTDMARAIVQQAGGISVQAHRQNMKIAKRESRQNAAI